MAGCGYHSPQFSEDITWLPPWLQPHQLHRFGDNSKDEHAISQITCKNQSSFRENVIGGHAGQSFTRDDSTYSSFHLYLSGEGDTLAENTPCSGQELHFRLHLSSIGVSQFSSSELNEIPQTGNRGMNKDACSKPLESPPVLNGTNCNYKPDNDAPAFNSPIGCNQKISNTLISELLIKDEHNNLQGRQGELVASNLKSIGVDAEMLLTEKLEDEGSLREHIPETPEIQNNSTCQHITDARAASDILELGCKPRVSPKPISEPHRQRYQVKTNAGNLRTVDINDAIELSIAASEAMVISEIASSCSSSENFPAAAILEIALRVKQARKKFYSNSSEAVSVFVEDELDETDQLSVDEDIMADAFDDVGLSVAQITGTLEVSSCDGKSQQKQFIHSNSLSDLGTHVSESRCMDEGEAQRELPGVKDIDNNGTISHTFDDFAPESPSINFQLEACHHLQKRSTQLLSTGSSTLCLRNRSVVSSQKIIQIEGALTEIQKVSEDNQGILKIHGTSERDTGIRKSEKEVFNWETSFISESMDVVHECTLEKAPETEREIVASSSTPYKDVSHYAYKENEGSIPERVVSSQDFLRCSSSLLVDPLCSIVPCSISSDVVPIKETTEDTQKFINSAAAVESQYLTVKATTPKSTDVLPSIPLGQGGIGVLGSVMSSRKQFNSLKPYSMLMPCLKTMHLFHTGKDTNFFDFNKEAVDKSVDKIGGVVHPEVDEPSFICETENNDTLKEAYHSEKRCSPIIQNNKKRSLQACKILGNDSEDESVKITSTPNMNKYSSEKFTNEVRCRDQTNITHDVPQQSSLCLYPSNVPVRLDKKVRFLEVKSSTDETKTGGRKYKYQTRRSHRRTTKVVKESSIQSKFESGTGKEIYNSMTSFRTMQAKGMIFQGLEFLLTGFSRQKEKELEVFIRKYGGYVLSNIPSSPSLSGNRRVQSESLRLPIVLSPRKVQTTKFLYGCVTNTWMLNANWLVDSVQSGSLLPPGKYMTKPMQAAGRNCCRIVKPVYYDNQTLMFDGIGIMLYGKASFCIKFSKIIKHGGGQVFSSIQRLVQSLNDGSNTLGALLFENEGSISRHLKHCAIEHNLHTVPASWIVNSLFSGKLLPFKKDRSEPFYRIKVPKFPRAEAMDMSQEI